MYSMQTVLLGFLILGLGHTVISMVDAEDYHYDDEYYYDYNDTKPYETPNDLPYFETSEYKKSAKVGDNISLKCDAKNLNDSYFIMWYNQTKLLSQIKFVISTDPRISVDDDYSLRINGIRESDAGQYQCKVLPHSISMLVNLEVVNKPTAVILDMDGRDISGGKMTCDQNDRIEIECRATGNPSPQIKWFSNGERIASGHNVQVNNGSLIIEHIDHEHAKVYQCLVDNEIGVSQAAFSMNIRLMPTTTEEELVAPTTTEEELVASTTTEEELVTTVIPITDSSTVKSIKTTTGLSLILTVLIFLILLIKSNCMALARL